MSQHQAAWIAGVGKRIEVSAAPTPTPSASEVLVRVKAVAINPVDYVVQDAGMFIKDWPAILGSDIAGEIISTGSSVTKFKKGDRVLGATVYLLTGVKSQAGFQEQCLVPEAAIAKIPDSMSFADACVLPLGVSTAAAGLYDKRILNLPLPSTSPKPTGQKILIWGGASSVGSCAVQLAIASGLEVLVTASAKNFDYVKNLAKGGNIKCFDYNSPSVVGDLTEALQENCVGAYDAITTRDTELAVATVLAQLGGGKIACTRQAPADEMPATVESTMVFAPMIFGQGNEVGSRVFNDFLTDALASGQFVPAPKADVVGSGLESVQAAVDKARAGVSASKVVVTL